MTVRPLYCINCDTSVHPALTECPECGFRRPVNGKGRVGAGGGDRPAIYVPTADYGRLETLAHTQIESDHPVASFLKRELERAIVRPLDDVPGDTVRMSRRVTFRLSGNGRPETRYLVYPHQYHPTGQYLSVLSPLGVAVLGLREGGEMAFTDLAGTSMRVSVERVA